MAQPNPSQTEVQAIDNLSAQVQSLQLQVEVLNTNLQFDMEALQLGFYFCILFFSIGYVFGIVASLIRKLTIH